MTNDEYERIQAINYSALRVGRTSIPRMHAVLTGQVPAFESASLAMGTMLHAAMQNGNDWTKAYAIRPEGIDRRTKAGKDAYAAWLATVPVGATILESATDASTVLLVEEMRRSIMSHTLGRTLATHTGESEVMIALYGRKCRIDKVCRLGDGTPAMLVDWKTTIDASPAGFARSVAKYGYHQQAAWYTDLAERHFGKRLPFVFVAVKSAAPHSVGVYQLMPDQLEAARTINEGIVASYAKWLENGCDTHHTGTSVETLILPEWCCKIHTQAASVGDLDETPF